MFEAPPHSLEAERWVLGSILIDEYAIIEVKSIINSWDFYNKNNADVFQIMVELSEEWKHIDLLTVREALNDKWLLERIGWNLFLADLTNETFTSANIVQYADIVKSKSSLRKLIQISDEIKLYANGSENINIWIYNFAEKILDIKVETDDDKSIDKDIYALMWYLEERKGKELFWWSWWENLKFLDKYTKWIRKKKTYRLWAWSNVWKTQFTYWIINNLLKQWAKVAFFTLENDKEFTYCNILANHQQVNSYLLEKWECEADIDYLKKQEWRFYLIDDCYDLSQIYSKILQLKPDVVFLDYVWLVDMKLVKETDKYTEYSKSVQKFVKKSWVSWIDLSNLSKEQEEEKNIREQWHFYWSWFLKQNTDVWIHMCYYKPFYEYKKKALWLWDEDEFSKIFSTVPDNERDELRNLQVIQIIISKNRWWTKFVEWIFKVNFNKWALLKEATPEELDKWK